MIVEYVRAIFLLTIDLFYFPSGLYLTAYKIVNQKAGNTYLIDFVLLHDASNVICLFSEYRETNLKSPLQALYASSRPIIMYYHTMEYES